MVLGSKCLVCINGALLVGQIQSIYEYNVVVELFGEKVTEPQVISKEKVIGSVSSEAFETIQEYAEVLVKENFQ